MKRGSSTMSPELREEIANDPEYHRCMIPKDMHDCRGRLTNEHALYFAGQKVQKKHAIVKACAAAHGVDEFQDSHLKVSKDVMVWIALNRSSDYELMVISKVVPYMREKARLNAKYGQYVPPPVPAKAVLSVPPPPKPMRDVRAKVSLSEFEREVRAFARSNGVSLEAAEIMLNELV